MEDGHWVERIQNLKIYVQIQRQFPSHLLDHTAAAILHDPIGGVLISSSSSSNRSSSSSIFWVILMHEVSNKAAQLSVPGENVTHPTTLTETLPA